MGEYGGGDGIRTHGFYLAKVALSQLSYAPTQRVFYTQPPFFTTVYIGLAPLFMNINILQYISSS